MFPRFTLAAAAVASLFAQATFAAAPDDEALIIVTATRIPSRVSSVLSDVTVITQEQIKTSPAESVVQLLSSQAGISLTQTGGKGANSSLFIRGTNANHALVLIDGQRVSSATTGTAALEHLPLEQIERVEIIRGPASSLYGADALGGVIQIFTKTGENSPGPSALIESGSYGTKNIAVGYGGGNELTSFSVHASREKSEGFSSVKAPSSSFFDMFNPDRDGYVNKSVSAQIDHQLSRSAKVGAKLLKIETKKQFDSSSNCDDFFTLCTTDFDNRQVQDLASYSGFVSVKPVAEWETQLRVGSSEDNSTSYRYDPVLLQTVGDRFNTTQDQVTWQNDISSAFGKFLLAADWRKEKVDSTRGFVVDSRTSQALIVGYQGSVGAHSLQTSVRVDDIERLGSHKSGTIAYGYQFTPQWRATAATGRSFHAPTFNDLYWPVDQINFFQGNPNLAPEKGFNREVGLRFSGQKSHAGLTYYRNEISGLLDFVNGQAPTFIGTFENLNKAVIKGTTFTYSLYSGPWRFHVNADWLSATNPENGLTLQRRAPRFSTVEIQRSFDRAELSAQVVSVSHRFVNRANTQELPGYAVLNLVGRYTVSKELTAELKLNNALDKDYAAVRDANTGNDYGTARRSVLVGLRYQLR